MITGILDPSKRDHLQKPQHHEPFNKYSQQLAFDQAFHLELGRHDHATVRTASMPKMLDV